MHQVPLRKEKDRFKSCFEDRFKGKQLPEKRCYKQKKVFPGVASASSGKRKVYPSTDQRAPPSSMLGRKSSQYRTSPPACNAYEQAHVSPAFPCTLVYGTACLWCGMFMVRHCASVHCL